MRLAVVITSLSLCLGACAGRPAKPPAVAKVRVTEFQPVQPVYTRRTADIPSRYSDNQALRAANFGRASGGEP